MEELAAQGDLRDAAPWAEVRGGGGPFDRAVPMSDLESAADVLRDFYLRSHRVMDRLMASKGASFARAKMLMHISRHGSMRSTDLSSSMGLSPRTVTEAIDGLERDGLVRRHPYPGDRRAKRIALTPLGSVAVERADATRLDYVEAVFSALSPTECREIISLVGKLNQRLTCLERRGAVPATHVSMDRSVSAPGSGDHAADESLGD